MNKKQLLHEFPYLVVDTNSMQQAIEASKPQVKLILASCFVLKNSKYEAATQFQLVSFFVAWLCNKNTTHGGKWNTSAAQHSL